MSAPALTGLEAEALRLYGLSQPDIDKINAAIPAAERLVALVNQAQPMIDEALALNAKAQPLMQQAVVELKAIMPAALVLRTIMASRSSTAASSDQQAADQTKPQDLG